MATVSSCSYPVVLLGTSKDRFAHVCFAGRSNRWGELIEPAAPGQWEGFIMQASTSSPDDVAQ